CISEPFGVNDLPVDRDGYVESRNPARQPFFRNASRMFPRRSIFARYCLNSRCNRRLRVYFRRCSKPRYNHQQSCQQSIAQKKLRPSSSAAHACTSNREFAGAYVPTTPRKKFCNVFRNIHSAVSLTPTLTTGTLQEIISPEKFRASKYRNGHSPRRTRTL